MNETTNDSSLGPRLHAGEAIKAPVKIYDAWNSWQAQLLAQELTDAGIAARVASTAIEFLSGKVPYQAATCPVWVDQQDVQRARPVILEFERRLAERGEVGAAGETFCYHCGAKLTARQSPCPHCGGVLDWSP